MDGIAPNRGYSTAGSALDHPGGGGGPGALHRGAPTPTPFGFASPHGPDPAAVKTPAHYLGAARRRIWLILAVAVPLSIVFSILALRQPKIYQARAEVMIEPPQLDPILSTLVARELGHGDASSQEKYAPNMVARLTGGALADRVVKLSPLAPELAALDDPARELIVDRIAVKPIGKTNMYYYVTLEGKDPSLTRKLLEELLKELKLVAYNESHDKLKEVVGYAEENLSKLKATAAELDKAMFTQLKTLGSIGPGGKSIIEERYISFGQTLAQKQARMNELSQKLLVSQLMPRFDGGADPSSQRDERMAALLMQKEQLKKQLNRMKGTVKRFDSDPAVRDCAAMLNDVMDEIEAIGQARSFKPQMAGSPGQMILDSMQQEIQDDQQQHQAMLTEMQAVMPDHQKFLGLMEDRQQTRQKIAAMERDIEAFKTLSKSQKDPVRVPDNVVEPTVPIKPNRLVSIILGLIVSFGMGFGLVFALEHFDHSVRVPEHVSHGLSTPLLGVVPRITRTSRTHRGGHLWTPGAPDSLAADAFRNVRASLLGVADRHGPIISLLVTSAKAGDGKSTAALNLAATCARAGERTLLLDVDLRRPSLDDVFPADPDDEARPGLVDVLRGVSPWQQALRRTDLHNLDFIATGDPSEVPIEILGTLELRQLLSALSHHYDRVILDGPAVLGMADCRVLGRMVDASVLVVRAGVHPIVTLQRAKAVLEQSQVEIAGVIVNSLCEGVRNWSSYGYAPAAVPVAARPSRALPTAASPPQPDDASMLMAATAGD